MGLGAAFAAAIPDDTTYADLSEAVARLTVGMFLKTAFEKADRLDAFDEYCTLVRAELVREIEAGEAE